MVLKNIEYIQCSRDDEIREPDQIIPGLRAGQVGFLTAPGGTGKSFLLMELAMSVATGETLIPGIVPGGAGSVKVLNFEDDAVDLRNRGISILQHFHHIDPMERLYMAPLSGSYMTMIDETGTPNMEEISWLRKECEGMRLVILDPLSHLHFGDENSNAMMSRLVQILKGVGRSTGTGILIAHHASKASVLSGQGHTQQSGRGASALTDGARVVMTLTRDPQDSYLLTLSWAKLNSHRPIPDVSLRRAVGGVLVGVTEGVGGLYA